jgi:hypothetical protein
MWDSGKDRKVFAAEQELEKFFFPLRGTVIIRTYQATKDKVAELIKTHGLETDRAYEFDDQIYDYFHSISRDNHELALAVVQVEKSVAELKLLSDQLNLPCTIPNPTKHDVLYIPGLGIKHSGSNGWVSSYCF